MASATTYPITTPAQHQQTLAMCSLMTTEQFRTWYAQLDAQSRQDMFPSFDEYLDATAVLIDAER